jgi:DNA topoisomerase-2
MRITQYIWNSDLAGGAEGPAGKPDVESSASKFDLAFDRDKADARKEWLNNGIEPDPVVPSRGELTMITYDSFIDNRLKVYSAVANVRAIPNLYDGLKPGQRKILFAAFKRGLKERIKVVQLSGYVSEHAAYHYGDSSLNGTIVHMAQDYVGVNNINYLYPSGGFGSRLGGGPKFKKGEDAAAPRYIYTFISPITWSIFHQDDKALLNYITEEGQSIEPVCFMPTVPMVLINGARGIGTGYSTEVAQYNPKEVVANLRACMRGMPQTDMIPWFKGYRGEVLPDVSRAGVQNYITVGKYVRLGPDKIRILELPVGAKNCKSYQAYCAFLSTLLDDETAKLHGIKRDHGRRQRRAPTQAQDPDVEADDDEDSDCDSAATFGDVVHDYEVVSKSNTDYIIDIVFKEGVLDKELANNVGYRFEKKLKLAFTISCSNMHLYVEGGTIRKFSSPADIISEYCRVRVGYYTQRRERLLRKYELDIGKANSRYRFVTDIMDEVIDIRRKNRAVVEEMLETQSPPYPKFTNGVDDDADKAGYKYLLGMEISSFTAETLERLRRELDDAQARLDRLAGQSELDLWDEDLDIFLMEYDLDVDAWYKRNEMQMQQPRKKLGCQLRGSGAVPAPALVSAPAQTQKIRITMKKQPLAELANV